MEPIISYLISVAASATVAFFARPIWYIFSSVWQSSDLPKISGEWIAEFTELTELGGESGTMSENVTFHQIGRVVWGEGGVIAVPPRNFKYRGFLKRQTFIGTYARRRSNRPGGSGTFELKVCGDDDRMEGWCLWDDSDTERIEASRYTWRRI